MKQNIVFVSIFDLTEVSFEVSKELQARGHSVSWMTTNDLWREWLMERGVKDDDILHLVYQRPDFLSAEEKAQLQPQIVACEANADLSVNQCLLADRFVLYKNKPDINEYVYLYYRDIKRFLELKEATLVFAESTNTNDLMTYMICRELGIRYLQPKDMRFPHGRVIFCDGYLQSEVLSLGGQAEADIEHGRALLEQYAESRSVPLNFRKLCREPVVNPRKLVGSSIRRLRLIQKGDRTNLTHHDLSERVKGMTKRLVNGFYLRHLCTYSKIDETPGRMAFYPLHVQPENSIDVLGSYFSDQLKLVKDIRRALPFDTTLFVKEHPNFLGLKDISFFNKIRRIPNVRLLRHDVSNYDIYEKAAIIFTVSGTSGYEAGMLGIPVVTFSPMFFGGLSSVHYCPNITELKPLVFRLLTGFKRDFEADCRFMGELFYSSLEGQCTDPFSFPAVMGEKNLTKLKAAYARAIEVAVGQQVGSQF